MHATIDLARRVDRAEIDFCAIAAGVGAPEGVAALEIAGGVALYSTPGSPLNKVLGIGLQGPVPDSDLDRLEAFYAERGSAAQIELCPLAAADLPPRLSARRFLVQGFENELARWVDAAGPLEPRPHVTVTRASAEQEDLWTRVTAEGFVAYEPPVGGGPPGDAVTTEQLMAIMAQFRHPKIRRYLAWMDGEPAGGAASFVHDGVVGIYGMATLPRFRRRGVQTALASEALRGAAGDADLAIATTAPGSTSQRTFERLGFRILYTRTLFVKEPAQQL